MRGAYGKWLIAPGRIYLNPAVVGIVLTAGDLKQKKMAEQCYGHDLEGMTSWAFVGPSHAWRGLLHGALLGTAQGQEVQRSALGGTVHWPLDECRFRLHPVPWSREQLPPVVALDPWRVGEDRRNCRSKLMGLNDRLPRVQSKGNVMGIGMYDKQGEHPCLYCGNYFERIQHNQELNRTVVECSNCDRPKREVTGDDLLPPSERW